jgi:HEAT repeat protein
MATQQIRSFTWSVILVLTLVSAAFAGQSDVAAAGGKGSPAEKQRSLIRLLESNAAPGDKAIACKELAIYGTKDAVPALAALLSNPDLASWARIALEVIPDSAADAALRKAMGRLQGKLLVGTINSIGVRRDAKAVAELGKKLDDPDASVVSAAAVALGRIGGTKAARVLEQSLARGPVGAHAAVAEGCILCAERLMLQSQTTQAAKLYDAVRSAAVPKQRILEATRGAILARESGGLPLLIEQLRSPDKASFGIGLRTARELPGLAVTEALAAELDRCSPDRQPLLLLAIADRSDTAAAAAVLKAAQADSKKVRLAAINALEPRANAASLPVLLEAAAGADADVAQAAIGVLTRLPGNDVDTYVLDRLPQSSGKTRQVLIELAGRRRVDRALPAMVGFAADPDAGVRCAAVQTIGILGDDKHAAELVRLLSAAQAPKERADIEAALIVIGGRSGARCVPHLLPLAKSSDATLRITALHALASAGGPEALGGVKTAIDDGDESVRDEAVRTLSTWPNNWPEDAGVTEPLLTLAKYSRKTSYQVLGLRGYLQYVQGDKRLKDDAKAGKVKEVLPLLKRPEEQRLAIGVIGDIPTAQSLELLVAFAAEPAIADDACSAVVKLAGDKGSGIAKEQRQQALQTVVEKSTQDETRQKAKQMLKAIQ